MPPTIRSRPSPRLALYGLAFRLLRRVALSGEKRRETTPAVANEERNPRRTGRPAPSLCPPGGEQ